MIWLGVGSRGGRAFCPPTRRQARGSADRHVQDRALRRVGGQNALPPKGLPRCPMRKRGRCHVPCASATRRPGRGGNSKGTSCSVPWSGNSALVLRCVQPAPRPDRAAACRRHCRRGRRPRPATAQAPSRGASSHRAPARPFLPRAARPCRLAQSSSERSRCSIAFLRVAPKVIRATRAPVRSTTLACQLPSARWAMALSGSSSSASCRASRILPP